MARLAWPHLPNHKLTNLAREFGISYRVHDAMEDARCAGEILQLAAQSSAAVYEQLLAASRVESQVNGRIRNLRAEAKARARNAGL